MKRIVFTRNSDGGVSVMTPSKQLFEILEKGGWWDDSPIGVPKFIEKQVQRAIKNGVDEKIARKFAEGVAYGGVKGEDAWQLIIDRFCKHLGSNFIKMSFSDLPDRWFRDAWRQNSNGAITIDLEKAKVIQKEKIVESYVIHQFKTTMNPFNKEKALDINSSEIEIALEKAATVDEVRSVWPKGLPCYEWRYKAKTPSN